MTDETTPEALAEIASTAHDMYMAAHPPSNHGWRAPPWAEKSPNVHAAWDASVQAVLDRLATRVPPLTMTAAELAAHRALATRQHGPGGQGLSCGACELLAEIVASHNALALARSEIDAAAQHNAAIMNAVASVAAVPEADDVQHNGTLLLGWVDQQPEEVRPTILKMARIALDSAVRTLLTEMGAQPAGRRNFVTVHVERGEERYALTLQREAGLTPSTLIGDLKDDVARLTAEAERLKFVVAEMEKNKIDALERAATRDTALAILLATTATAVGLFSSAVKSGEKWSDQCEEVYQAWRIAVAAVEAAT